MKSTNHNKVNFTIEDFEKGLMLAGLISPIDTQEIEELEVLKNHEADLSKKRSQIYFKRAVLAAEIVNQLKSEPTFGRVKFQKLTYLCEHACKMNLQDKYAKFAAGPFDNKFMHSINSEFKRQKWFNVKYVKSNGFNKPVFSPSVNIERYKTYYNKYFQKQDPLIQEIINLFRKTNSKEIELVATIYYCLLEMKEDNSLMNNSILLEYFYKFADSKRQFSKNEVLSSLKWMNKVGVYPLS